MTREILFAMALPVSLLLTSGTLQLFRGWLVMVGYDHPETASRPGWLLGAAFLVSIPILFVLQVLVSGGAVEYLDETDKGNEIAPAEALDRAQDNLGALIGATLRAYVIVLLIGCTLIGIPWAIARAIRWVFLPAIMQSQLL